MFPLACKITYERKIELASIYLGTLCHGLDALVNAATTTNGKEKLSTPVDVAFLQMFVCKRFKRISPTHKHISYVYVEAPRAWSWTHSRYTGTEMLML